MSRKILAVLLAAICLMQSVSVLAANADTTSTQTQQASIQTEKTSVQTTETAQETETVQETTQTKDEVIDETEGSTDVAANELSDAELQELIAQDPGYAKLTDNGAKLEQLGNDDNVTTIKTLSGNSIFDSKTYTHNSRFDNSKITQGLDVSYWDGNINWSKVKAAGVDFAIVRVGYRSYGSGGGLYSDRDYVDNIKGAIAAGIKVGVYIYSQAITQTEAKAEANYVLSRISGYKITLPVVMDFEYADNTGRLYNAKLSKTSATNICKAFCETVENAGYDAMVYANRSMLTDDLYASQLSSKYQIWLANYTTKTSYTGDYDYWQFSESGRIAGISTNVDCNFWYQQDEEDTNAASSVEISDDEITLTKGKTKTLSATLTPASANETVQWSSSNTSVATVSSSGKVTAAGRGTATITAKIANGKTVSCAVTVNESLSACSISDVPDYIYNGKAKTPSITVKSSSRTLTKGTDYTVTYSDNVEIGTATITVEGKGDGTYTGTLTKTFKIYDEVPMSVCTISSISAKTYTGSAITPSVTIKNGYFVLENGKDYTLSYSANTNPGKATVTINGKGDYAGTEKTTFTISPAKISNFKKSASTKSSITLSWSKPSAVSGYVIYRVSQYGGSSKLIKTITDETQTSYKNTGLKTGYEYTYSIKAYKVVDGKRYYGSAVSVATQTKTSGAAVVTKGQINLRKGAGTSYATVTKVAAKTVFTPIAQVQSTSGYSWYKVSYKKNSKTYTGYISASTTSSSLKGTVNTSSLTMRSNSGTSYKKVTTINKSTSVKIKESKYNNTTGATWLKVTVTKSGKTYTGYCNSKYITLK